MAVSYPETVPTLPPNVTATRSLSAPTLPTIVPTPHVNGNTAFPCLAGDDLNHASASAVNHSHYVPTGVSMSVYAPIPTPSTATGSRDDPNLAPKPAPLLP